MPVPTLAQGIENLTNKIVSSAQLKRNSKKEPKVLQEVDSKREKYVKHFIKEDKTFEAVVYPFAAHYKEGGVWKDIDNNIVAGKDDENNDVLENKSNDFKVQFGEKSDASKLVSIKKDGYEVSWNINKPSVLSSDTATSQVTDPVASVETPTVEKRLQIVYQRKKVRFHSLIYLKI